ncbi:MAG TPA: hypothetical protein VG410_09405 [Solirubrobacteraceae bacterium]|jgi:hypothetical protein|nr:hypothetical protein [Solirubrobacteraceae bacterium]
MSGLTPTLPGIPGSEPEHGGRLTLDFRLIAGALIVGLGLGMLVLGAYHAFEHGTCSTTGYAANYGPVPHCAKGIGWWAGMLVLGIFVAIGGGVVIANRSGTKTSASAVTAVLAAAVGVAGALGMAAGITSIIGKVTTPSTAIIGSGGGSLSAAQVRANKVKVCKDVVLGQRLLSAGVKSSLTSECQANPAAAVKRFVIASKAAAVAYSTAQCKHGIAVSGLPASAQATLSAQCGKAVKSGGTASTAGTAAKLCREIVKAQVPVAAQPQALAHCPKS